MLSTPIPENAIRRGQRVFVALQKSGRVSPGRAPVFHAVTPYLSDVAVRQRTWRGLGLARPARPERHLPRLSEAVGAAGGGAIVAVRLSTQRTLRAARGIPHPSLTGSWERCT